MKRCKDFKEGYDIPSADVPLTYKGINDLV